MQNNLEQLKRPTQPGGRWKAAGWRAFPQLKKEFCQVLKVL